MGHAVRGRRAAALGGAHDAADQGLRALLGLAALRLPRGAQRVHMRRLCEPQRLCGRRVRLLAAGAAADGRAHHADAAGLRDPRRGEAGGPRRVGDDGRVPAGVRLGGGGAAGPRPRRGVRRAAQGGRLPAVVALVVHRRGVQGPRVAGALECLVQREGDGGECADGARDVPHGPARRLRVAMGGGHAVHALDDHGLGRRLLRQPEAGGRRLPQRQRLAAVRRRRDNQRQPAAAVRAVLCRREGRDGGRGVRAALPAEADRRRGAHD
mmetsp:Transcript_43059/g.104687  ORF Transcript_43059/g.104687 Transcript_43059/m.104687 type:complete len:267 (-) Transcript_43059:690-1490(-)